MKTLDLDYIRSTNTGGKSAHASLNRPNPLIRLGRRVLQGREGDPGWVVSYLDELQLEPGNREFLMRLWRSWGLAAWPRSWQEDLQRWIESLG